LLCKNLKIYILNLNVPCTIMNNEDQRTEEAESGF